MANALTPARIERIRELRAEGMELKDIAVETGIPTAMVNSIVGDLSDRNVNGTAPVSEDVGEAVSRRRESEARAGQAHAEVRESRAHLEQQSIMSQLLQVGANNPSANAAELQEKVDDYVSQLSDEKLERVKQEFASTLSQQNDIIEAERGRQRGPSELEAALPAVERILARLDATAETYATMFITRFDRLGLQVESRLPPAGWPTISKDPIIDRDKLLDDLVAMANNDVVPTAKALGIENAEDYDPDDLRMKIIELTESVNATSKPLSVPITQWPNVSSLLPQLLQLIQGLNLPDLGIGRGGQNGVGPEPLSASLAPDEAQIAQAETSLVRLRCPQCNQIASYDLNRLRASTNRYEPCPGCNTLFDLGQYLGGESTSHLPRYRPS